MKISILKENLKNSLSVVEKITGRNLTLPILNNVLITTEKNFLSFITTDLEIGIKWWTLAKIEREGKIVVPARFLLNLVSSLPNNKKIDLEVKNQILYLTCENYKTQIKGFDPEEFPIFPKIDSKDIFEVENRLFCQGLSKVIDIVSPVQVRPEISGIYLDFQKNLIKMVATDSFRLAEKKVIINQDFLFDKGYSLILPQKTARELINILTEKEGKLKIYLSPNQIMFEFPMIETPHPQLQIISRLIEGEYPNYQEIIPQKYETQITLLKNEFLEQIKTAGLFSGKINEIKCRINPKEESIEIFSQNSEIGESKSFLYGKVKGEKTEVSFNWKFLVDGLVNISTREIIFGLNGEKGPAILKPVDDPTYFYIVMPIKTS